jgi:hypothetical protein
LDTCDEQAEAEDQLEEEEGSANQCWTHETPREGEGEGLPSGSRLNCGRNTHRRKIAYP